MSLVQVVAIFKTDSMLPQTIISLLMLVTSIVSYCQIHIHDNGRGISFPGSIQYNTGYGTTWNMSENGSNYYDQYFTNSEDLFYQGTYLGTIAGDRSSAQSVMVAVGDSLYVFYVDDYDQTQQGYYTVVDMTTQTIVRTVNLGSPYSEKITAEQFCFPTYYYVLMQRCNGTYEVRRVDSTGVSLHSTFSSGEQMNLCIGCAMIRDGYLISSNFGSGGGNVNIYDFTNGNVGALVHNYAIDNAYGVALINPDAYVGERTFGGRIWHLDYLTGDSTAIATTSSSSQIGQMVVGDGRVYVARFTLGNLFEITPPQSVSTWPLGFSGVSLGMSQSFDTCTPPMLLHLDTTDYIIDTRIPANDEYVWVYDITGRLVYEGEARWMPVTWLPSAVYVIRNKYDEGRLIFIE